MTSVLSALTRRSVLVGATAATTMPGLAAAAPRIPIIDAHIHLFDPRRPQGVPYRGPDTSPTHATGASPAGYARLARPLGIVGAIEVEASPWVEDNLWVLEQAATNTIIVGTIGNLKPEAPDFAELLGRFARNPLFRGIRYGNIWDYDLPARIRDRSFLANLRHVAEAGLVFETANQRIDLLEAVLRINDAVPDLSIVIDHLPAFEPDSASTPRYEAILREMRDRPRLACKLSEIIHRVNGIASHDVDAYRGRLDLLYHSFGEDRVVFGSDWPESDGVGNLPAVVAIARRYMADKPVAAQEKFFWRNAARIYRWIRRSDRQPA